MSDNPSTQSSPGLPDEAMLARLADEFVAAARGGVPAGLQDTGPAAPPTAPTGSPMPPDGSPAGSPTVPDATMNGAVPAMPASTIVDPFSSAPLPHVVAAGAESLFRLLTQPGPPAPEDVRSGTVPAPPGAYYFLTAPGDEGVTAPAANPVETTSPFDVHAVRQDFPILSQYVNGHRLVWMDNAATTQKPQAVIDRISQFYTHENSNVHRGAHELARRATDAFESARDTVARFLGAASSDEIVFVRGTTEAINLVAQSWGRTNVGEADEVVITHLEHHSNIVPWQQLVAERNATLRVAPVDDDGQILLDEYRKLLNPRTRLVAVSHVSNALGTVTPVRQIAEMAHAVGALVLVDGAQAVAHIPVDVAQLGADFYAFSGHKIFGPTGIGALYGRSAVLSTMPPWQGGGNMISDVTLSRSEYQDPPARFEAGTNNIADAVGLGAALDYVQKIGLPVIARYEHDLLAYATDALRTVPGLQRVGTAPDRASVLSFVLAGHRPEEVGEALNREGIAVRSGHHCAQPILRRYGLESTVRPSLAFYNTVEEVDLLVTALRRLAARSGHR